MSENTTKPRYPGVQHVTFAELEEFCDRLLRILPTYSMGYYVHGKDLRNHIAQVYHEMVRERADDTK